MQRTLTVSKILILIFRFLSVIYFLIMMYSAFCIITGLFTNHTENGKFLKINFPFTNSSFLNVENNWSYILFSFIVPIFLYSVFFYLTSNVFNVFLKEKLFTVENVKILKKFYFLNIFLPFPIAVVSMAFVEVIPLIWLLVLIHFIMGIFIFYLSEIFLQGVKLQNEQDLII